MSTYTIGQVAERTGFTTSTLRYYEDLGIVVPATRTDSGYRIYGDEALSRLAFIARAKQLGCSLDEVTDLLAIWDDDHCGPVQRRFHDLVTAKIHATQQQIKELAAFTSQLQTVAAHLDTEPVDGPCHDECACMSATARAEPEIACALEADAMPDRLVEWQNVLSHARQRSTTSEGRLRIEFSSDVDVAALIRFVEAEQRCCAFFSFALTLDVRGIALEVDAPNSAAPMIDALFAASS
jgi:DNA-binding transcriptional MerR regulator